MNQTASSRTELIDSILHTDVRRMIVGMICGVAAGMIMLVVTTVVTPAGYQKLWWLQLCASVFFKGPALAYDISKDVLLSGLVVHFGISAFCGLIVGKLTKTSSTAKLAVYGLVLGGLCWLASNMFAPDFLNILALEDIPQWSRMFIFQTFSISTGVLMSIASKTLKI